MGKENRSTVLDNPTCTFVSDAPYIVAATLHEQHFPNPRPPVTHELCLRVLGLLPWTGVACFSKERDAVHI